MSDDTPYHEIRGNVLFCVGLAFQCVQNFAVSGLCALSGLSERLVARACQHND